MISNDANILADPYAVQPRMIAYGALVDELHIVVLVEQKIQDTSNKEQTNSKFKIQNTNVTIYPTHSKNKWMYVFNAIRIGKDIVQNASFTKSTAIITTQDPFETGIVGRQLSRKFNIPLHVQVHADFLSPYFIRSFLSRVRLRIAPFVLRSASAVRVVSKRIRDSLTKTYRISASRISVLPIFVDARTIEQMPVNTSLKDAFPQFQNIILMVSRLAPEKNIEMALRAFQKTARRFPDTGLIIVGSGPEQEKLEQLVAELSLEDNVHFEGERTDVVSFYKTATLFLHTSDFEGYGMALVEAAASGCPIVTTNVGLIGEALTTDNAFVCEPQDQRAVARQLGLALENKSARIHVASTAKKAARAHAYRSHDAYLEAYKKDWKRTLG